MKAENKSWKDIRAELGRSKHALTARFKEIKDFDGGDGGAAKKDEGGKKNDDKKDDKKDKKKDKQEKHNKKQPAEDPSKVGNDGQARFTMGEWMTLQEDDLFSFGELQCLSELIMRDESQRWLRIAAAFFDRTGRRVHPEDVREKFEEMASMG